MNALLLQRLDSFNTPVKVYDSCEESLPHHVCTIIPEYMQKKILKAYDDKKRWQSIQNLDHQNEIRNSRTSPFFGPFQKLNKTIYKVFDMKNGTDVKKAIEIKNPGLSKHKEAFEAYTSAFKTNQFFRKFFQRNSIDNHNMDIDSVICYGEGFNNAFWNGKVMVYGDGDGKVFDRLTKGLDVTAHELFHGVTQYDDKLEYKDQSGALNESLSDVFGIMVNQYYSNQTVKQSDWLIGKDVVVGPYALRSMKAPGTAFKNHPVLGDDPQPGTMDKYVETEKDNGGVHINSGIPNHAFYLACQKFFELNKDKYSYSWSGVGKIWYKARRLLKPNSQFTDFSLATVFIAEKLFGIDSDEVDAVKEAWLGVKLKYSTDAFGCQVL